LRDKPVLKFYNLIRHNEVRPEGYARMSLNLNPDIEARLIALAQSTGVSVEDFLLHVVEEKTGHSKTQRLSPEEWGQEFDAWADSSPEAPPIPDEALSRENLYPDRW
jgi:hypothetical protein